MDTHRVTIDIPEASFNSLRSVVESGKYASETDVILELIAQMEPDLGDDQEEFKAWMLEDVLPAIEEFDADPSSAFTPEQLRIHLAQASQNWPDPI